MSDVAQEIKTNIIFNAQNAIRNSSLLFESLQKISNINFSEIVNNISKLSKNLADSAENAKNFSKLGKEINNFAKFSKPMDNVGKSIKSVSSSFKSVGSEQENLLQRQKRLVNEMVNLFSQDRNFNLNPLLLQLKSVNHKIADMYLNMKQLGQAKRAIENAMSIAGDRSERYGLGYTYEQILKQINNEKARLQQYQYDVDYNGTRARVDKYKARLDALMANKENPEQRFIDAAINLQKRQEKSFANIEQRLINELSRLKFDKDSGKTLRQNDLDARIQKIYNFAKQLQNLLDGGKVFNGEKFPVFPVVDQMLAQIKNGLKSVTGEQKKLLDEQKIQAKKDEKISRQQQKEYEVFEKKLSPLLERVNRLKSLIDSKNSRGQLFSQKDLDSIASQKNSLIQKLSDLTGQDYKKILDKYLPQPLTGVKENESQLRYIQQVRSALQKKTEKQTEDEQKKIAQYYKDLNKLEQKILDIRNEINRKNSRGELFSQKQLDHYSDSIEKIKSQILSLTGSKNYSSLIDSLIPKVKTGTIEQEKALQAKIQAQLAIQKKQDLANSQAVKNEESLNQKRLKHLDQLEKKARQVSEVLARINDKKISGGLFSLAEVERSRRQIERLIDDINKISSVDLRPIISNEFNKSLAGIQYKPKDQKIIDNSLATQLDLARKKAVECATALEKNNSIANQLTFLKSLKELRSLENQVSSVNKRLEKTMNLFENIGQLVSKRMTWYFGDYLAAMTYEMPVEFIQRYRDLEQAMAGVQQVIPLIEHNQAELNNEISHFLEISHQYARDAAEVIEAGQLWGRGYGKPEIDLQIREAIDASQIQAMSDAMINYVSSAEAVKTTNELVAQSALLATVDNFSLIESVKGLEAVLAAYGLRAETAAEATLYVGRAVDVITKVAHYGQISAQDLVRGIEATGAAAAETGISLEFLAALIETGVRNTGLSGSNIGNAIKALTASAYTQKAEKELAKFGITIHTVGEDGEKRFRSLQDIILDVSDAIVKGEKNTSVLVRTLAGGRMQVSKLQNILKDPAEIIRVWGDALNSAGFANEQLEVQMKTLNAHVKQLKANFDSLIMTVSSGSVSDYAKKFVDLLANGIKYLEENLNGLKSVIYGFLAVKFLQFGISFVASVARMVSSIRTFSTELQRAGVANSSVFGLFKSTVAETGKLAFSSFTSGNFSSTNQLKNSIEQLKSVQNQDTSSKKANTAATVANSSATIANSKSRVANSSAILANESAKVANTAATNALTAAETRAMAVTTAATMGLNLLIGTAVVAVFELGKWILAEEDLEEKIDKTAKATKKATDQKENEIDIIKKEISERKSAVSYIDSAIDRYSDATEAIKKETQGSKEWARQQGIIETYEKKLSELFGADAIKRIKESNDKRKAIELEKNEYVKATDQKTEKLKTLNADLVSFYDTRKEEFDKLAEAYDADLKKFGEWTSAQTEGLGILSEAWSLAWQSIYNVANSTLKSLNGSIQDNKKELEDLISLGQGNSFRAQWLKIKLDVEEWLKPKISSLSDYAKNTATEKYIDRLDSVKKRSAELETEKLNTIIHGDEIDSLYGGELDEGVVEADNQSNSSSGDNRKPMIYADDHFMQAMSAIARQDGINFKTSQIWALAGLMSGNGDPWFALNSRSNNPFNLDQNFMDRFYPAGDLNNIFDTSKALVNFLKENKSSVNETFCAFLKAMFPNLSEDEIKSKVKSVLDESDYLDTIYDFDKNLDDVHPKIKSYPVSFSNNSFDFANLETATPSIEDLYRYFRAIGYSHNAAKGWIANIVSENSSLQADIVNPDGGAFGLFQLFEDRKDKFFDWAQANNRDPYSALTQLDYARLVDIPERGSWAGMSSYTDDFYFVPVPKVKDFSPNSLNSHSAEDVAYILKARYEHPGEAYPDQTMAEHMTRRTHEVDFLDDLEYNVENNLNSVGGNVLKMYAQGMNDCTLQATRAIMQAYLGKNFSASDWNFSTWFDDLVSSLSADVYDFSPEQKINFESVIEKHFNQFPDRPIMLYQGRGAGSYGDHKINSHSGTHATVIGRKLENGKYQIFDSAGSKTHDLNLNEIIDMSAHGDPNNGIVNGNILIVPNVAPSNPITSWQIESGNAAGNTFSNSNRNSFKSPVIRENNLGLDAEVDSSPKSSIILHHTDDRGDIFSVDAWHRKQGWSGIGYHFLINKDGSIDRGRPEDRIGAHAQGSNIGSLGIAMVGKYQNIDEIPEAQWNSLVSLVSYLCKKYNIDPKNVTGHRDHNGTDCPGDTVYYKLPDLINSVLNAESNPVDQPQYAQGDLDPFWSVNSADFKTQQSTISKFRANPIDSLLRKQKSIDDVFQKRRLDIQNRLKLEPDNPQHIQDQRLFEKDYLNQIIQDLKTLENIQSRFDSLNQNFLQRHPDILNALKNQNVLWSDLSSQEKIDLAKRANDESFVDIINQEEKIRLAVIESNKKFDEQKEKILELRDVLNPEQIEDLELKQIKNIYDLQSAKDPEDPTIERSFKRAQLAVLRKRLARQQEDFKSAESLTDNLIANSIDSAEKNSLINNRSQLERDTKDKISQTQNQIAQLELSLKNLAWLNKKDPSDILNQMEENKLNQLQMNYNSNLSQNLLDDRLLERFYQRRRLDVLNQRLQRLKLDFSADIQKDRAEKENLLAEIELNKKNLDTLKLGTNEYETQKEKIDLLQSKLENIGLEEKKSLKNLRETQIEINNINKSLDDRKFISEQIAKIDAIKLKKLDDDFSAYQTGSAYLSPSIEKEFLYQKLALLEQRKAHEQDNLQSAIADRVSQENSIIEQIQFREDNLKTAVDFETINRLQAEIDDLEKQLDFLRQFGTDETNSAQNSLNQTNSDIANTKKTIKNNSEMYSENLENELLNSARLDFENASAGQLFDDGSRGKEYAKRKIQILYQRQARLQSLYQDAQSEGDLERSVIRDKLNEQQKIIANTTDTAELERQRDILGQLQAEYNRLAEVGTDAEMKIGNQMKETSAEIQNTMLELDPVGTELTQMLASGFKDLFSSVLLEGKSFSEGWKNLWSNIARFALNQLLEIQLQKMFVGVVGGASSGGSVKRFADGGFVNLPRFDSGGYTSGIIHGAGSGTSDSILTYLEHRGKFIRTSDGEFIIKQDSVEKLGLPFLNMINDNPEAFNAVKSFANGGNLGEEMIPQVSSNVQNSYKNFVKNSSERNNRNSRIDDLMSRQNALLSQYSQPVQQTTNMNINAVDSKSFVQLLNRHSDVLVALLRKEQSRRNGV